jgi:hypothetical protein
VTGRSLGWQAIGVRARAGQTRPPAGPAILGRRGRARHPPGSPPAACTRKPLNPPVTSAICQRRNALVTVSHRLPGPRTTPSMGQDPSNQDTAVEIRSCPAGLDTVRQRAESVRTTMSVTAVPADSHGSLMGSRGPTGGVSRFDGGQGRALADCTPEHTGARGEGACLRRHADPRPGRGGGATARTGPAHLSDGPLGALSRRNSADPPQQT